jgi:hypothetical protein
MVVYVYTSLVSMFPELNNRFLIVFPYHATAPFAALPKLIIGKERYPGVVP